MKGLGRILVSEYFAEAQKFAKMALEQRLHFTNDSTIRDVYARILKRKVPKKYRWVSRGMKCSRDFHIVTVALVEGVAVGAMAVEGLDVQFYVKRQYRRQGLATSMFRETALKHDLSGNVLNRVERPVVKNLKAKLGISGTYRELRSRQPRHSPSCNLWHNYLGEEYGAGECTCDYAYRFATRQIADNTAVPLGENSGTCYLSRRQS